MVAPDQTQDRVAQQLQTLVTLAAAAAPVAVRPMLQRQTEQPAVAQPHVELALQLRELSLSVGIDRWKRGSPRVSAGHTCGLSGWRCARQSPTHWTSQRRLPLCESRWAGTPA